MALDPRPGFAPLRLARLVREAVGAMELDLRGRVVYTEAATGAYVVTPILAALAGAERVIAVTRTTRHGTVDGVRTETNALADLVGLSAHVTVTTERHPADIAEADVVTNSGHVRPIDAELISWMKPDAVVPLMFESWEIRAGRFDVDLEALRTKGIAVAGTNERHPAVGVFEHLGPMVVAELIECGVALHGARIALVCDNPFRPYLVEGLRRAGAKVWWADTFDLIGDLAAAPDVLLVAATPTGRPVVDGAVAERVSRWPSTIVVQYWGDIDRAALRAAGVAYWPTEAPPPGHMAVLPSAVGPEPIVRLQAGGLKVAQVLLMSPGERTPADMEYVDAL